jgi:hypothetical protein
MGEIIAMRISAGKVRCKLLVDEKEALHLRGNMRKIHLFSAEQCSTNSRIIEKGKDGVTKHFMVPINFKTKSKKKPDRISYSAIDLDNHITFIYIIDKNLHMRTE